ncbi:hypothetical protein EVAR_25249_1 [Eumeta japonica]|uniref:Uncharacterized protein n=1 Tax=Eumeta variegata TaxID=151549 RepID=A0A4C1VPW6_EUMVA|nr:hypothetical protein EVAR_25249_1 [Eumeta japonica]
MKVPKCDLVQAHWGTNWIYKYGSARVSGRSPEGPKEEIITAATPAEYVGGPKGSGLHRAARRFSVVRVNSRTAETRFVRRSSGRWRPAPGRRRPEAAPPGRPRHLDVFESRLTVESHTVVNVVAARKWVGSIGEIPHPREYRHCKHWRNRVAGFAARCSAISAR